MKKINYSLILVLLTLIVSSCNRTKTSGPRERMRFTQNWKFILADQPQFSRESYNDTSWRTLNLPHDWSIEGKFSEKNPSTPGGGALPGGIGWYRKTFRIAASDSAKKIYIDFDGVYMNSSVYLNGHLLGTRPYGYSSFRYNLTPWLHYASPNVIAVRVDNSEQPNARWYTGSGIYRNVWLVKTNPTHISHWGTYVTTPKVSPAQATVAVQTTFQRVRGKSISLKLITTVISPEGNRIISDEQTIQPGDSITVAIHQQLKVTRPKLWTIDHPAIYTIVSRLYEGDRLQDEYRTSFGIRSFRFDARKGFFLNGQHLKIKGVCIHNDLGCLGTAVNKQAIRRRLELLKNMGCNGIRTSHNPPSPELLDLCDQMGFIVMDETFDMWRKRKTTYDYSRYFPQWYRKDLSDHILRDRNHPSVFMWSIGNEVLEQWSDARADTLNAQEANLLLNFKHDSSQLDKGSKISVNSLLTKRLADIVNNLDPTRPVTSGNNEPSPANHVFKSGAMAIIGFNYHTAWIKNVPANFPGKPFICTESTSALMTRGYYRMPSDSTYLWPTRWDIPFSDPSMACSSYDNCHTPWGDSHEHAWEVVRDNDFISGTYIWTGFDYLGEPTPYWWPARSSYFGILDLAGIPKDIYYLYQSEWTNKDVLHLFPHWNWKPGQTVDLWAYYNHADEVELYVNGKSMGAKHKTNGQMHVMWRVHFEPGSIRAVSRKNGKIIKEQIIKTAGNPAQIELTADRNLLQATGRDLSFVTVRILDKDGNLVPNATNEVRFSVNGHASIAGVDNGDPTDHESLKGTQIKAFYGKCVVVIQSGKKQEKIRVTASSDNLKSATSELTIQ